MKRILIVAALAMAATAVLADTSVQGHFRKDGTYVPPHHRTNPDGNRGNNWSSQGNTNPYTGEQGTVNPYTPPPVYTPPKPYNPYR